MTSYLMNYNLYSSFLLIYAKINILYSKPQYKNNIFKIGDSFLRA